MLIDGVTLVDETVISNMTVSSGTTFPTNMSIGELYYRTSDNILYVFNGSVWNAVAPTTYTVSVNGKTGIVTINKTDLN